MFLPFKKYVEEILVPHLGLLVLTYLNVVLYDLCRIF